MRRPAESREDGFTLIEVLFTMVFFGIMVAIVASPYAQYRQRQEHVGSTRELVAFLRRAQVRAVAEETTYRVDFSTDGKTVTAYKSSGGTFVAQNTLKAAGSVKFTNPSFVQEGGAAGTSAWFYMRGSAGKGSVTVTHPGTSKTYTVNVEGLTARVSYTT